MKFNLNKSRVTIFLVILAFLFVPNIFAQTTTFVYQGKLPESQNLLTLGTYDLQFNLYDEISGNNAPLNSMPLIIEDIQITDGNFSVFLNFGSLFNTNANRFIEIGFRGGNETGSFTLLPQRQQITSNPFSIRSIFSGTSDEATNALNLGGMPATSFVQTEDSRLTDEREPKPGSDNYIQNSVIRQVDSNFNIDGIGKAKLINVETNYEIGGNRVLGIGGAENLFVGKGAGNLTAYGNYNSLIGTNAGFNTNYGIGNSFFGYGSGLSNVAGIFNTTLGANADVQTSNLAFASALGSSAKVSSNDTIVIGKVAGIYQGVQRPADTVKIPGNLEVFGTINGNIGLGQVVKSLNGLTDNVNLVAGNNITITPSANNSLTISSTANVNSGNFIQNTTSQQASSNFNISGNGTAVNFMATNTASANVVNATTQYNIGGNRVFSIAGSNNIFLGVEAGLNNTAGYYNSFVGNRAGKLNTTGTHNSFVGFFSGAFNTTGATNSFFGSYAGHNNTTGSGNSIIGASAGLNNTTGYENSFVGLNSGYSTTTGFRNSFFGANSGYSNTTGERNAFIGAHSGNSNTSGFGNAFLGWASGYYHTTGSYNTFSGLVAGYRNTTGSDNVLLGAFAGDQNATGNGNTFVGTGAGHSNDVGSNNTAIGLGAEVYYGNLSYATAIGARAVVRTNHTIVLGKAAGIYGGVSEPADKIRISGLGSSGNTSLCLNANFEISNCSSSLRYKTNIESFNFGLDFLNLLKPITFDWKETGIKDVGFGAEDVAAINPLFAIYNEKGEVEGVKYDRISTVLVNSVKEQQIQIEQLRNQNQELQKTVDGMKELICLEHPEAKVCQ
jgi:hypothetical protein